MSHVLNELISVSNIKAVEEEARVAEIIAEHSVRIKDALSRIEKAKKEWEPEYSVFDPGPRDGIAAESKGTKARNIK